MTARRRIPQKKRFTRSNGVNALALLFAIPAFGYGAWVGSPQDYVTSVRDMVAGASASLTAQVSANPYNTTALQLAQKEALLNQREADLNRMATEEARGATIRGNLGLISFGVSIVLFVLVGINFFLDMRRERRRRPVLAQKFSVDLR